MDFALAKGADPDEMQHHFITVCQTCLVLIKSNFLISQPKHMLWVLK